MKCECGFEFSGPGEYRNCSAYIDDYGDSVVICPECGKHYKGKHNNINVLDEDI